ncbi:MAG: ABC transporter permease, partial [Halocynthiibacter sp.]
AALMEIVGLSIAVSLTAVFIAGMLGITIAGAIALSENRFARVMRVLFSALMGLPPVVVGLFLYILLSRSGPLGVLGLLYTPWAMILAQVILILPIIVSLSTDAFDGSERALGMTLRALGGNRIMRLGTHIVEQRAQVLTAILAGLGRAFAEVGAVMIVGGNIDHLTRVMTTAIALETSKGNLTFALALGLVLLFISFVINALVMNLKPKSMEVSYGG